jgi:hypothetical protein
MALYGIDGIHSTNAKLILKAEFLNLDELRQKYKINKILGQYHSALEHTFLWILDAEDPHLIQQFCIESGLASFNSVKIIPLITTQQAIETVKKVNPQ